MVAYRFFPLAVALSFLSSPISAKAQGIRLDLSREKAAHVAYFVSWDQVQAELVTYRGSIVNGPSANDFPSAKLYRGDGSSTAIYILRDFPEIQKLDIWAGAATPRGGAVLSCVLVFPGEKIKSVLLTYGRQGRLEKMWEVFPYLHRHLAVDQNGDVFALGTRDGTPGPLLIEYSPSGEVVRQLLPSITFPRGQDVLESGSPLGESRMFMDGNDLTVWLASERQLFRFSLLGELVARESLDPALAQLVTRTSASKVRLNSVVGSSDGGLIAAAQLQPNEKNARDAFALVKFSPDGKSATLLTLPSIEHGQGSLIGDEPDGKLVFLEKSGWEFDVTYRELDKRRPPE